VEPGNFTGRHSFKSSSRSIRMELTVSTKESDIEKMRPAPPPAEEEEEEEEENEEEEEEVALSVEGSRAGVSRAASRAPSRAASRAPSRAASAHSRQGSTAAASAAPEEATAGADASAENEQRQQVQRRQQQQQQQQRQQRPNPRGAGLSDSTVGEFLAHDRRRQAGTPPARSAACALGHAGMNALCQKWSAGKWPSSRCSSAVRAPPGRRWAGIQARRRRLRTSGTSRCASS
jgi:hypothetical protein